MMEKKTKTPIKNKSVDLNKTIDNHLSIQISLDGFSFCIINKNTNGVSLIKYIPFQKSSSTPKKHLKNVEQVFQDEDVLNRKYDSVNISHINDLSTLVPKPLFDPEHINNYIKYSSKTYVNDYIVYDEIENHDIINVYIPFVNINNFLLEKFGNFEYKHFSTILIGNLLNIYKFSERPHVFVDMQNTHFEVVVIANNKLLLYNSFKYQTKEDFIYYLLFTAEQLKLSPEKFELVLSGNIKKDDDFYNIAFDYVRNISLLENRSKYTFDDDFNEETKRKFFTLLNQF